MHTKLWEEIVKAKDHSEDLGADGEIILQCILGKLGGKVWNGCI
jgi:hypothetical protein